MLTFGKKYIEAFFKGFAVLFLIMGLATYTSYSIAREAVNEAFPELVRLVAEDNCLDDTIEFDGKTTYKAYKDKLQNISTTNSFVSFESDAITVPYTSRATAPQRGTEIPIKLVGYWTVTIPLFSGLHVHYPIVRQLNVIGIREYRDR